MYIIYIIVYLLIKQRGLKGSRLIFQVLNIVDSFLKTDLEVVNGLISRSYKIFFAVFFALFVKNGHFHATRLIFTFQVIDKS